MFRFVLPAPAAILIACAGGSTPAAAPEPEMPQSILYAPGTTTYLIVAHSNQEQEFQGQTQSASGSIRVRTTAEIAPGPDGMSVVFTVDSVLEASGPGIFSSQRNGAAGSKFTASFSPTGEVGEVTAESENALMRQIGNAVRLFYPTLPAGGATAGAVWTDTSEVVLPTGQVDLTVAAITTYTAGEWGDMNGARTLPVSMSATISMSGSGEQAGAQFSLMGTGTSMGTLYLGADGRYLGTASSDSLSAEVHVDAAGLVIPIKMIQVDSVTVVR